MTLSDLRTAVCRQLFSLNWDQCSAIQQSLIDKFINNAVTNAYLSGNYSWARRGFGLALRTKSTLTNFNLTQYGTSVSVSTPQLTTAMAGCWVRFSGYSEAYCIESVDSQTTATLRQPFKSASATGVTGVVEYNAAVLPAKLRRIMRNTVVLVWKRKMQWVSIDQMNTMFGYLFGNYDYGQSNVFRDQGQNYFGQPLYYNTEESILFEGQSRLLMRVYPSPDNDYIVEGKGYYAPDELTVAGAQPQLPEHLHRLCVLPMALYEALGYEGIEIGQTMVQNIRTDYSRAIKILADESTPDQQEDDQIEPGFITQRTMI